LIKRPNEVFKLLQKNNLFSPEILLLLLLLSIEKGEIAIVILYIHKENYSITDLSSMRKISELFENLENRESIKASKSLFWKDKKKKLR
jgi:hypothetical protein